MKTVIGFLYRHRVVTLLIVAWALGLVTWVTVTVFNDLDSITANVAAALATVFALPALAFGLWKWRAGKTPGVDR